MATRDVRHIDVSEMAEASAWLNVIEDVRESGRPAIVRAHGEDLVEIRPAPKRQRRGRAGFSAGDALWSLVSMVDDDEGPTDVSSNKHRYLAEAYTPKAE